VVETAQVCHLSQPATVNGPSTQASQTMNARNLHEIDFEFEALAANLATTFEATQSQPNVTSIMTYANIPP